MPAVRRRTARQVLSSWASTASRWHETARQRRQLRALASDGEFLADIGLSYVDAIREADKPFWKR